MQVDIDIRSFKGFDVVEHIVLESDNPKATNTFQDEQVKPHAKGESFTEEGKVVGIFPKMSWNIIRLQKVKK